LGELKSDVLWGTLGALAFYVAAARGDARVPLAAALAGLAFWPALAAGLALSSAGWNARLAHMGVVAYSTYLVTVAPLLMLLVWQPPAGWNTGWRWPGAALLPFVLVVATARMSDNRIVWIALAAGVLVLVAAWRPALPRGRTALATAVAIAAFGILFVDAMRDRAREAYPPQTSVEDTLVHDPRLAIWRHAAGHLRERPWTGYGYGRLILRDELRADTGDRLLTHAHNMFVSQALQTGAVGVVLLLALFGTVAARYVGLARSGDELLRRLGALGLAVLAAFVVKNLTDDFFFRANLKLLFAVHALLLGMAALRERELSRPPTG
ncbi:MAG TPA: O-antigen ligase family protein, partial [Casimicrobiaceae bacterium]|nr:O-antigen ligase family protein [Casimicrobiaceae bacterium]